jgi:Tol biopolymer transport system component
MATWWRTDFGGAVQEVLGISDRELHRRWIESLQERYGVQEAQIRTNLSDGDSVRAEGYMNLYPRWSPDGGQLGFLSNAGSDYGRTSLYTLALADTTTKLVAPGARTAFDWSPGGSHLVFARRGAPNSKGSRFWDLHTVDPSDETGTGTLRKAAAALGFPSEEIPGETRLSRDLRAVFPAYAPDGSTIAFVQNRGGSTNLAVMGAKTRTVRFLTNFSDGTLVYTPRWSPDGGQIAFSIYRPDGSRDIAVIPVTGGEWTPLISTPETDRDPAWTPDGDGLVFSSDIDGVFDLYHLDLTSREVHRITRVLGGALQPDVHPRDGRIAFSHYGARGYEIRVTDGYGLWQPADSEVFLPDTELALAHPDEEETDPEGETRPYRNDFAPLTVLPRVAFDAGKLKLGVEAGSDDILGKQGLFFVGMLSPNRDMDLYAAYEFRRWRPTLFLEAYRVVRHVDEDVSDRDLDYRIYDRDFTLNGVEMGAKYRMRRGGLFDARLVYSRYGWVINQARFNGLNRFTVGATYLNGFDLSLSYRLESIGLARDMEINPRSGREFTLKYTRAFNFFLRDFKQNSSVLIELYDRHFYNQLTLEWNEYVPVGPGRSALGLRLYGGLIDKEVDDFFDFHLGGLPYMKGYTFYGLEGSRALMLRGAYRFPVWSRIHRQTGPIYSDQLFGSVYAGIGRAWDGNEMDDVLGRGWKRDVGAQIRYDATSFYLFPTRLSFDIAYGFDTVPLIERGGVSGRSGVKAYFTLLFGYLQSVGL